MKRIRLKSVIPGSEKLSPVTGQNSIPGFYRIGHEQKRGCLGAVFYFCSKNGGEGDDVPSIVDAAECSF